MVLVLPRIKNLRCRPLDVVEEVGVRLHRGDEGDGDVPEALVGVADDDEHGILAEDAMDGLGVAALEELLLVLQYVVVEVLIA